MKKLLALLFAAISIQAFSQTLTEQQTFSLAVAQQADVVVVGQTGQTALNNNILLSTAGATSSDLTAINNGKYLVVQVITTAGVSAGAFTFEQSLDGTTFVNMPFYDGSLPSPTLKTGAVTPGASSSVLYKMVPDGKLIRCRISTLFSGGSISAIAYYRSSPFSSTLSEVVQATAANLQVTATQTGTWNLGAFATAAMADGSANPTLTAVQGFERLFNSSTWDRYYNNYNTTTGDAGAKGATFNGATQTNFNAKGATITVLCGTVTGSTPTLNAQLQFSPDAGTTWLAVGAASPNVTATGNTITFQVYPTNFTVAGATPAALAIGATQTVQINSILPRTWRLAYTIGGSTPSFAITAVYVNYQL